MKKSKIPTWLQAIRRRRQKALTNLKARIKLMADGPEKDVALEELKTLNKRIKE